MKTRPQLAGVTWTDVQEWIEDFERETTSLAEVHMRTAGRGLGQPLGLTLELVVTGYSQSGRSGYTRRYKASWPTYAHKTMPGLILYLIHSAREDFHYRPPTHRPQVKSPAYPRD